MHTAYCDEWYEDAPADYNHNIETCDCECHAWEERHGPGGRDEVEALPREEEPEEPQEEPTESTESSEPASEEPEGWWEAQQEQEDGA